MNKTHDKLLSNLKKLIPCIKGKWVLSDGALLGLTRNNKLIPWDNDLDIYLYPNSYIDKDMLKQQGLEQYEYYVCDKIFNPNDDQVIIKNKWFEFLDYVRVLPECEGYNRPQLTSYAKSIYSFDYKSPLYKTPSIDIMYLEKQENEYIYPFNYISQNSVKYITYTDKIKTRKLYDITINIPENDINILKQLYGKNWVIPNKKTP